MTWVINSEWLSIILGRLFPLTEQDAWQGTDDETYIATQEIEQLFASPALCSDVRDFEATEGGFATVEAAWVNGVGYQSQLDFVDPTFNRRTVIEGDIGGGSSRNVQRIDVFYDKDADTYDAPLVEALYGYLSSVLVFSFERTAPADSPEGTDLHFAALPHMDLDFLQIVLTAGSKFVPDPAGEVTIRGLKITYLC